MKPCTYIWLATATGAGAHAIQIFWSAFGG
jgi:hypothetical protein